jgi:methylenetetrahydrofolate dehydrogenase (NADP+)/methenyltetrahydrofolate cyclohydrolase
MAQIIDGKAVAAKVRDEVKSEVAEMDRKPGLATILVGDDPASAVYVRMKREDSAEVGIESFGWTASCSSCRCPTTSTRTSSWD